MVARATFLCSIVVTLFCSLTCGPIMDKRGQPTTVVAIHLTAFDAHIRAGNASIRSSLSIWVNKLGWFF
jgi:hypothetical protein